MSMKAIVVLNWVTRRQLKVLTKIRWLTRISCLTKPRGIYHRILWEKLISHLLLLLVSPLINTKVN